MRTWRLVGASFTTGQYIVGRIYEFHVNDALHDALEWYDAAEKNGYKHAADSVMRVQNKLKETSTPIRKLKME